MIIVEIKRGILERDAIGQIIDRSKPVNETGYGLVRGSLRVRSASADVEAEVGVFSFGAPHAPNKRLYMLTFFGVLEFLSRFI